MEQVCVGWLEPLSVRLLRPHPRGVRRQWTSWRGDPEALPPLPGGRRGVQGEPAGFRGTHGRSASDGCGGACRGRAQDRDPCNPDGISARSGTSHPDGVSARSGTDDAGRDGGSSTSHGSDGAPRRHPGHAFRAVSGQRLCPRRVGGAPEPVGRAVALGPRAAHGPAGPAHRSASEPGGACALPLRDRTYGTFGVGAPIGGSPGTVGTPEPPIGGGAPFEGDGTPGIPAVRSGAAGFGGAVFRQPGGGSEPTFSAQRPGAHARSAPGQPGTGIQATGEPRSCVETPGQRSGAVPEPAQGDTIAGTLPEPAQGDAVAGTLPRTGGTGPPPDAVGSGPFGGRTPHPAAQARRRGQPVRS
jgi:hypothetical protein